MVEGLVYHQNAQQTLHLFTFIPTCYLMNHRTWNRENIRTPNTDLLTHSSTYLLHPPNSTQDGGFDTRYIAILYDCQTFNLHKSRLFESNSTHISSNVRIPSSLEKDVHNVRVPILRGQVERSDSILR